MTTSAEARQPGPGELAGELALEVPPPAIVEERTAGPSDFAARLEEGLAALGDRLVSAFEEKASRDRFREEQVDRLHAELQQHRGALSHRLVRPYLDSLIRLHDDLAGLLRALRELPDEERTADRCLAALADFREDLEVALSHHGVESFSTDGDRFDPQRQTAARTLATEAAERSGAIAERLLPGFRLGDVVLQRERVVAYRHVVPITEPNQLDEPKEDEDER